MLERFIALRPFINDIVNHNISAPPMVCAKDIEEIIEKKYYFKAIGSSHKRIMW